MAARRDPTPDRRAALGDGVRSEHTPSPYLNPVCDPVSFDQKSVLASAYWPVLFDGDMETRYHSMCNNGDQWLKVYTGGFTPGGVTLSMHHYAPWRMYPLSGVWVTTQAAPYITAI